MDLEHIKKMLSNRETTSSTTKEDFKWYSLPKGVEEVKLRFLPVWEGGKAPGVITKTHWNLPLEDNRAICLKTFNLDCPICDALAKYEGKLEIKDWVANGRAYFNVLVFSDKANASAVNTNEAQILGTSEHTLYWLFERLLDPEVGDITDLEKGHNVTVKRKTVGGAFERQISLKPTPVADSPEKIEEVKKSIYNLSKIWKAPDDNTLNKIKETASQLILALDRKVSEINKVKTPENLVETPTILNRSAPAGAPECFGDASTYGEDSPTCIACPYDFQCKEKIEG